VRIGVKRMWKVIFVVMLDVVHRILFGLRKTRNSLVGFVDISI